MVPRVRCHDECKDQEEIMILSALQAKKAVHSADHAFFVLQCAARPGQNEEGRALPVHGKWLSPDESAAFDSSMQTILQEYQDVFATEYLLGYQQTEVHLKQFRLCLMLSLLLSLYIGYLQTRGKRWNVR